MERMKSKIEDKRILYVYTGNHPVHRKFAETVTKESVKFSWKLPKNYDIYFFEGEYAKPVLMRMLGLLPKKSKIIILFADPRLYYLKEGIYFDKIKNKILKMSFLKRKLAIYLLKKVDGVLCEGNFNADLYKRLTKKSNVSVIEPFIWEDKYLKLRKINPQLNNKNILFVGNGPDYYVKGLNILLEIFKDLKKDIPDSKLFVLGYDWEKIINKELKNQDIFFEGKKEVYSYLKNSSLLIHLGRGEGFGINVLESLYAGVPAIVSDATGAKESVKKVSKNFVVPLEKELIKKEIVDYFGRSMKEKIKLSKKAKKIGARYRESIMLDKFKKRFYDLIKVI